MDCADVRLFSCTFEAQLPSLNSSEQFHLYKIFHRLLVEVSTPSWELTVCSLLIFIIHIHSRILEKMQKDGRISQEGTVAHFFFLCSALFAYGIRLRRAPSTVLVEELTALEKACAEVSHSRLLRATDDHGALRLCSSPLARLWHRISKPELKGSISVKDADSNGLQPRLPVFSDIL